MLTSQIDREFLDHVDVQVRVTLDRVRSVEETLEQEPAPQSGPDLETTTRRWEEQLTGWQQMLSRLTQETAQAEGELNIHEAALRRWLELLAPARGRIAEVPEKASRLESAARSE